MSRPVLSVGPIDRASRIRTDEGLLDRLLADAATRVLLIADGRAPLIDPLDSAPPRLRTFDGPLARELGETDTVPVFLGYDDEGTAYVTVTGAATADVEENSWGGLRDVAGELDERDAGLLTGAVAIANWHSRNRFCSNCGHPTDVVTAGWARKCPNCGTEHYPRVDPAVIMAVVGPDERILLGRNALWPERRFSTLAGFVEPGETLEDAVRREVTEEVGVKIGDVEYRGSQPWPMPQSLMLGYRAYAISSEVSVDVEEIAEAQWWSREELAADVAAGHLLLPGRISIARALIEDWYGGPLSEPEGSQQWR